MITDRTWKSACMLAELMVKYQKPRSAKIVQKKVEMATGIKMDGRTIAGMIHSRRYHIGKRKEVA